MDFNTPEQAREYIEGFSDRVFHGKTIDRVNIGGRWLLFKKMTDDEAVKIATSLYRDIEVPAAKGIPTMEGIQ